MTSWQVVAHAHHYITLAFTGLLDRDALPLWHGTILALAAIKKGPVFIDVASLNFGLIGKCEILVQLTRYVPLSGRTFVWCGAPLTVEAEAEFTDMAARLGVHWAFEPDLDTAVMIYSPDTARRVVYGAVNGASG